MKLTIENTDKIITLDGVPARIWKGWTDSGIPVLCYVTRIAVAIEEDSRVFETELQGHHPPSADVRSIPLKMIPYP